MQQRESLENLWRNLRTLTRRRQYRIAEQAGVSAEYFSDIVNGKANPTIELLLKIAHVLGTTVGELLTDQTPAERENAA